MKFFIQSKTIIVCVSILLGSFSDIIDQIVKIYPSTTLRIIAVIFIVLRFITKEQLTFIRGEKK